MIKHGDTMNNLIVGSAYFGDIVRGQMAFVDKTLFIKEMFDRKSIGVSLITRPRRFGKTMNLSMLHHFLVDAILGESTKDLFRGLMIEQYPELMKLQGTFPVISMTFKDIKGRNWDHTYAILQEKTSSLYREHQYILEGLTGSDKETFKAILDKRAHQEDIETSLLTLSRHLFHHHKKKPWILIDEYDTPITEAYLNKYYEPMTDVMKGILGSSLKDNPYLDRAVLTGILRIAKESLFSGLNNIQAYSVLDNPYSTHFGFTEDEVKTLLQKHDLMNKADEIKRWYNGYQFGRTTVYNPWSINNSINNDGLTQPYWVNTSENALLKDLIFKTNESFRHDLETMMRGETVEKEVDPYVTYRDLQEGKSLWALLISSGYLKILGQKEQEEDDSLLILDIPNLEIRRLYRRIIREWFVDAVDLTWYKDFMTFILNGDMEGFEEYLRILMDEVVSHHDTSHNPEAFYHGLMLGLTSFLYKKRNYTIRSNRESGYGRYDYAVISEDKAKPTLIFEFKRVKDVSKLEEAAIDALTQIDTRQYVRDVLGNKNVRKIGLSFCGKEFCMRWACA